jgi:hypothetical protein
VAEKDDATEIATNEDESSETRAASVSAATSSEGRRKLRLAGL